MPDTYTPTTDEVREAYAGYAWLGPGRSDVTPEFDRWLAAHDAQVRAEERERVRLEALDVTISLKQRTGGFVEYVEAAWLREALEADRTTGSN